MENHKLLKKIEITGRIICKTGLHIGGSNTSMSIGGIDNSVIRNPLDGKPYIPGSSLKGKLRALLQISTGSIEKLKKPSGDVIYSVTKSGPDADLFGNATGDKSDKEDNAESENSNKKINQKPSRLIVRDCYLIKDKELLEKTEIPYTEGKTEVVIDRITSAANPRQIERVPAGAEFGLNMILNIWNDDDEPSLMSNLFKSFELLSDDYLGGNGSRGYGQVSIVIEDILEKGTDTFYSNTAEKPKSIKDNWIDYIHKLQ